MAQLFILYDVTRAICQTYFVCSYNIISIIYYLLYYNIFPTLYLPRYFHSVIIIIISRTVGSPIIHAARSIIILLVSISV